MSQFTDAAGQIYETEEDATKQVHTERAEQDQGFSGASLFFTGVISFVLGGIVVAYAAKQTVARGTDFRYLADRLASDPRMPDAKFKKVVRDPEFGNLLRVNGFDVVASSGPVFAWLDDVSDPPVIRAANLFTGQEYPKTFKTQAALETNFDTVVVPYLDPEVSPFPEFSHSEEEELERHSST